MKQIIKFGEFLTESTSDIKALTDAYEKAKQAYRDYERNERNLSGALKAKYREMLSKIKFPESIVGIHKDTNFDAINFIIKGESYNYLRTAEPFNVVLKHVDDYSRDSEFPDFEMTLDNMYLKHNTKQTSVTYKNNINKLIVIGEMAKFLYDGGAEEILKVYNEIRQEYLSQPTKDQLEKAWDDAEKTVAYAEVASWIGKQIIPAEPFYVKVKKTSIKVNGFEVDKVNKVNAIITFLEEDKDFPGILKRKKPLEVDKVELWKGYHKKNGW